MRTSHAGPGVWGGGAPDRSAASGGRAALGPRHDGGRMGVARRLARRDVDRGSAAHGRAAASGEVWTASATRQASASAWAPAAPDRKSTRLNSSHSQISYAVFCLKKKNTNK